MRIICTLLLIAAFSCNGHAQTVRPVNKDSLVFVLKSFDITKNKTVSVLNYSFKPVSFSTRFTMLSDSYNVHPVVYDSYMHEYYTVPCSPYRNFKSALLGGSLKYLFMAFGKEK